MDHKNQHWIPKSYLKEWCDPRHKDKVIHRYDRYGNYLDWRPPSRVFSSPDLYTISVKGERITATETRFLKEIEDLFLKVLKKLKHGEVCNKTDKFYVALFTAAMRNRSPSARDHWQRFKDRVVEVGDGMVKAIDGATPKERKKMLSIRSLNNSGDGLSLEDAKKMANEPFGAWLPRHINIEAQMLRDMSLTVVSAPSELGYITSDNPVIWHNAEGGNSPYRRHLGLGHPGIEVTMPLNPEFCALFDHSGTDGRVTAHQRFVDEINSRILGGTERYFVASSPSLVVNWYEKH